MEKPEILAPAGSMAALKAAFTAGADAVYMGGSSFGARAFADNPDREEMVEAIRYAHLRGKRLYLTVNTLIKEQEFSSLYDFLAPYYEAGLDAAIVQDVGALHFLAKEFPGLSLHASTQMTLTSHEGVKVFEGYPVTRLVPARELSLTEITDICKKSGKEVEIFVHGALCYCYSGQCLMSSMIGGRSGNRGRCAQPCRMEYESEDAGKKYWLSPKDLCGLALLPDLIRTGAASFKIEGRMKRPEYAAAVAAAYRKYTDLYFSLGEAGYQRYLREHPNLLEEEVRRLADVYNRGGFTAGCFTMHNGKGLMSVHRPGHFGVPVGEVVAGGKGEAVIRLTKPVQPQDVLELRRETEKRSGEPGYYEYTLGSGAKAGDTIKARLLAKLVSKPGDTVYRMKNAVLLNELEEDIIYARGNCDLDEDTMLLGFPDAPDYVVFTCGDRDFYISHGHIYDAYRYPRTMKRGDVLFCGHTHIKAVREIGDGMLYVNPGSVSKPKDDLEGSYAVCDGRTIAVKYLSGETAFTVTLE